jgi:adenylosuccinate lyase
MHRHEKDRNNWEIERAEMKNTIAKLEGETRANEKLQDGFTSRIKMLESMLKKERQVNGTGKPTDELPKEGISEEEGKETSVPEAEVDREGLKRR